MAPLLFGRALQKGKERAPRRLALGEAVAQRMIANETLAYFIGRTYLFMVIGCCPLCVLCGMHRLCTRFDLLCMSCCCLCNTCTVFPSTGQCTLRMRLGISM